MVGHRLPPSSQKCKQSPAIVRIHLSATGARRAQSRPLLRSLNGINRHTCRKQAVLESCPLLLSGSLRLLLCPPILLGARLCHSGTLLAHWIVPSCIARSRRRTARLRMLGLRPATRCARQSQLSRMHPHTSLQRARTDTTGNPKRRLTPSLPVDTAHLPIPPSHRSHRSRHYHASLRRCRRLLATRSRATRPVRALPYLGHRGSRGPHPRRSRMRRRDKHKLNARRGMHHLSRHRHIIYNLSERSRQSMAETTSASMTVCHSSHCLCRCERRLPRQKFLLPRGVSYTMAALHRRNNRRSGIVIQMRPSPANRRTSQPRRRSWPESYGRSSEARSRPLLQTGHRVTTEQRDGSANQQSNAPACPIRKRLSVPSDATVPGTLPLAWTTPMMLSWRACEDQEFQTLSSVTPCWTRTLLTVPLSHRARQEKCPHRGRHQKRALRKEKENLKCHKSCLPSRRAYLKRQR